MELIKTFTPKNKALTWALCLIVITIAVSVAGYLFGKFIWYLTA